MQTKFEENRKYGEGTLEPKGAYLGGSEAKHIRVRLYCTESTRPLLIELNEFLTNYNRLYELVRLATDPKYDKDRIDRRIQQVNLPLAEADRFVVEEIHHQSPLNLSTLLPQAAPSVSALCAFITLILTIVTSKLQRKELVLQVAKLQGEAVSNSVTNFDDLLSKLQKKKIDTAVEDVIASLNGSKIKIEQLKIETGVDPKP